MCGEQGFIAVHERVHLVKFISKGCSIFLRVLVTLLSTTGYKQYKVLKYSSRIHVIYLVAQQHNKLIQFPVCANVGVLFTLGSLRYSVTGLREVHPNSIFYLAISVLDYYTANSVMSCFSV